MEMQAMTDNQFSVFWMDPDGNVHKEREWVGAKEAVQFAHNMTTRPAARIGIIKRIIITDADDFTCFMWEDGKIIYPKEADILQSTVRHDH
jgi:hypothetical protein